MANVTEIPSFRISCRKQNAIPTAEIKITGLSHQTGHIGHRNQGLEFDFFVQFRSQGKI